MNRNYEGLPVYKTTIQCDRCMGEFQSELDNYPNYCTECKKQKHYKKTCSCGGALSKYEIGMCDNCSSDYTYCDVCKTHQNTGYNNEPCDHLTWSDEHGQYLGVGDSSSKIDYQKSINKILWLINHKTGRSGIAILYSAICTNKLFGHTADIFNDYEDYITHDSLHIMKTIYDCEYFNEDPLKLEPGHRILQTLIDKDWTKEFDKFLEYFSPTKFYELDLFGSQDFTTISEFAQFPQKLSSLGIPSEYVHLYNNYVSDGIVLENRRVTKNDLDNYQNRFVVYKASDLEKYLPEAKACGWVSYKIKQRTYKHFEIIISLIEETKDGQKLMIKRTTRGNLADCYATIIAHQLEVKK